MEGKDLAPLDCFSPTPTLGANTNDFSNKGVSCLARVLNSEISLEICLHEIMWLPGDFLLLLLLVWFCLFVFHFWPSPEEKEDENCIQDDVNKTLLITEASRRVGQHVFLTWSFSRVFCGGNKYNVAVLKNVAFSITLRCILPPAACSWEVGTRDKQGAEEYPHLLSSGQSVHQRAGLLLVFVTLPKFCQVPQHDNIPEILICSCFCWYVDTGVNHTWLWLN